MVIVLKRAILDISNELHRLEAEILQLRGSPTWHIVKTCSALAEKHTACMSMLPLRNASWQAECQEQLRSIVQSQLSSILRLLVKAGVYSPQLDLRYASFTLGTLVASAIFRAPRREYGLTPTDFRSQSWLIHLAGMLDRQFRFPVSLTDDLTFEPITSSGELQ